MLMGKVSIVSAVWTVAVLATVGSHSAARDGSNIIYQINATGSAVVLQTISTLQQSGVFGNDNELLRRIAYVETRDGKLINANHGGIWAVREDRFVQAQHLENGIQLPDNFQHIRTAFGINWTSVQWRDLRIPLYSAIAARFVLYLAPHTIPPANDLEAQARFWVQHYNTDGNENDFIGVANALQGGILDSSANEFFLGFSLNHNGSDVMLHLFVTTTESDPVRFTVNATGFSYNGIATQNSSTTVTLPSSLQVRSSNERNKGIYVKAEGNRKIVVYGLNYQKFTTDAFLALPCNHLPIDEYEYYAVSYYPNSHRGAVLIIGCEDNTEIHTGQSVSIINRYQTYLIWNTNHEDLTGRRIITNKPIAFFSNQQCANVPIGVHYCDHLTEQIPPTLTWGRVFLAASLLERRSGEIFRIVAAQAPTDITVNCTIIQPVNYLLTATTNWQEFVIPPESVCSITSTAPILVAQFALGRHSDNITGDPFMMLIPPVEQFNSNNYVFYSSPEFPMNYITVYIQPENFQPDRIFIDEFNLQNFLWSQIGNCSTAPGLDTCGYITRVRLTTAGYHRLYHLDQDARLGVSVYGFKKDGSYGHPGGMKLTPLQLSVVSFSSATYQYDEEIGGAQITITRSGNRVTSAVVLVAMASDNFHIITCDARSLPASPVLEFQPGETEKQITITFSSDITRIELRLSAGEGTYLTPFPETEIVNLGPDTMRSYNLSDYQTDEVCVRVCIGLDSSCQVSTIVLPRTIILCSWCIATGVAVFTAIITVGVIIVTVIVVLVFRRKKQVSSDDYQKTNIEIQKCDAYDTIKSQHSGQGTQVKTVIDICNPVYNEDDVPIYDTCY